MSRAARFVTAVSLLMVGGSVARVVSTPADEPVQPHRVDPAAWGGDHVGKPRPSYITGDECLFCHRNIGATWSKNGHHLTIRPAHRDEPAVAALRRHAGGNDAAAETRYLLGSRRITRYLRRSKEYGKLEMLSTSFAYRSPRHANHRAAGKSESLARVGELNHRKPHVWDKTTFGDRCAGCHATAVDAQTRAFSALSLDCFTCHGDVPLAHTEDTRLALLSSKSMEPRIMASVCGQCHLRGGKSKSSGLPYPQTFVPGDNLFRDFQVDFSDAAIQALPPIDQHIYLSARECAVSDPSAMSCSACHDVHGQSTGKHRRLEHKAICSSCHDPGTDGTGLREAMLPSNRLRTHSRVCDY